MRSVLMIALCAGTMVSVAQTSQQSSILFKHHSPAAVQQSAFGDLAYTGSIETYHYSEWTQKKNSMGGESYLTTRRYKNASEQRRTGIALTIVGGTLLAAGPALLAYGIPQFSHDLKYGSSDGLSVLGHEFAVGFGAIFSVAGIGTSIGGIISLVKANAKIKKLKSEKD